jgi:hypothetical protein
MNKFSTIKGNKFGKINRSCPVHKANELIRMQCKKHGDQDHTYCCSKRIDDSNTHILLFQTDIFIDQYDHNRY